ncbi:MAG: hypothetical protein FJ216_05815 [Ignavibacteria bacterium]|nr:hypothetical protein [Ignavibacteria bacterium]
MNFLFLILFGTILGNSDSLLVKQGEISGFNEAVSVTSDAKNNIYLLDKGSNELIKYFENLKEIKRIGRKGWGDGEFDSPTSIDGSSGLDIYVSDGNNQRIQRFDQNLGYLWSLYTWEENYDEYMKFRRPVSSVLVNSTNLYVIDSDNNRIVIFRRINNQSVPVQFFGAFGEGTSALGKPVKILKDNRYRIYIQDNNLKSIMIFDNFGNFITSLKHNSIISFSVNNDLTYILTKDGIYIYDADKSAYTDKIAVPEDVNINELRDILIVNKYNFYFLETTTLHHFILKKQ